MHKAKVGPGIFWVEEPSIDLRVLCGCPADAVKHLIAKGYITQVERDGVNFETGPNAILLSDVPVQQGEFCNLSEFPILQMFYRQGMHIPGHPNNTGAKPLLIGGGDQIRAQLGYIYRGTYGLDSLEEILETGIEPGLAAEMMRIKTAFAFGTIRRPDELVTGVELAEGPAEIRDGVFVERIDLNRFQFSYQGKSVEVDLDLGDEERFRPPFTLGQHKIKREYFSVVHTGEGDGWDPLRPCMASIVVFQGRIYLVDAGPNLTSSLEALGITVNEVDGIFHTHCHDDHFAGLPSLLRADHKLKYYATPLVRASVAKKLAALMGFAEDSFGHYFDIHDLEFDTWNEIDGLQVKPVYSPHPVEATVLFFQTRWQDGPKTYAHMADVASFDVLDRIVLAENKADSAADNVYQRVREAYLKPADIKKIDVGGGMIHGSALNYASDSSGKLVFSHLARELTLREKEIGSNTAFGMRDVLVRSNSPGRDEEVVGYIRENFPNISDHDATLLANGNLNTLTVGTILLRRDAPTKSVYLLTNGLVEVVEAESGIRNTLSAGCLIGEHAALVGGEVGRTYRAASFVRVLEIPVELYRDCLRRWSLDEYKHAVSEVYHFLEGTSLLGDFISSRIRRVIAGKIQVLDVSAGNKSTSALAPGTPAVALVEKGRVRLEHEDTELEEVGDGGFFGEESVILGREDLVYSYEATEDTRLCIVPGGLIDSVPIISWKLLESFERRLRRTNAPNPSAATVE